MELDALRLPANKKAQLERKGIHSVEDLLWNFPRKYCDYTTLKPLCGGFADGCRVEGAFKLKSLSIKGEIKNQLPFVKLNALDESSGVKVTVFWPGQKLFFPAFKDRDFSPQTTYLFFGTAVYSAEFDNWMISSPDYFTEYDPKELCLFPKYGKIAGMTDLYLRDLIKKALALPNLCNEPYPVNVAAQYGLPSLDSAIRVLHTPKDMGELRKAQERIIFDTLLKFTIQLQNAENRYSKGSSYHLQSKELAYRLLKNLPYQLTQDQASTVKRIFDTMKEGQRVNALIQGDVGSGKTIVAFLIMAGMVGSGYQCVLLAPSVVLAQQHYRDLVQLFTPLGVEVVVCTGSRGIPQADRAKIANGTTSIVVGTQALLSRNAPKFKDLALVIVDEEHKFGVEQKRAIVDMAARGAHSITMSATPIPSQLAQVLHGSSVEMFTIRTKPKGRLPVITAQTFNEEAAMRSAERQLRLGRQVFAVCPAIETGDKGRASVEEYYDKYKEFFEPRGYRVESLSSRDKKKGESGATLMEEKISDFAEGKIHILLSTVVIEVGVNIPNASMIVVHGAECFGMSQLHQLRGRVGRSSYQSYCVFVSQDRNNERLAFLCDQAHGGYDGYTIAMKDLEMRGPGDWIGTRQSGNFLPVQFMLAYPNIYQQASTLAAAVLDRGEKWPICKAALEDSESGKEQTHGK